MTKSLLFLLLFPVFAFCQTPQWTWAKTHALASNGAKQIVANDAQGNVYVAGDFSTTTMTIGNITLTNPDTLFNLWQIYLAKYDSAGNLLWARDYGSSDNDSAVSLTVDNSGNVYLMGTYQNTTSIDGQILSTVYTNGFVAKLDSNGNAIWAKTSDGGYDGWDAGEVAVDASGNVYFSGVFASQTISFGGNVLNYAGFTGTNYNVGIPFLVKLNSSGNVIWAKGTSRGAANTGGSFARALAVDSQGNIFVAGGFLVPELHFGNVTLTKTITSNWNMNSYLVKYDSNGNVLWGKNAGTNFENTTMANGLAIDNADNVIVTGVFCNTIDWDGVVLSASGGAGPFLLKYDTNGAILWGKTTFGNGVNTMKNVRTDAQGGIYVAGNTWSSSETFGTGITLTTAVGGSAYIAKYNPQGNAVWVQKAGKIEGYNESSMSIVSENEFYLSGTYTENQINFGTIPLVKNPQTNYNRFLARMLYVPLGVDEHKVAEVTIYPNPTKGKLFLNGLDSEATYDLIDATGRKVQDGKITTDSQSIDLSNLPSGIYFIKMRTSTSESLVRKIVKS